MGTNEQVVAQIKEGDITAFKSLFDSLYLRLYFHCRKFVSNPEEAKDLLQNVFLRLWERRNELEVHTSLNAYLYRAVQNECLNYLRSYKGTNNWDEALDQDVYHEYDHEEPGPYSDLAAQEIEQIVEDTVEKLPDQCRSIFKLSRVHGLKNYEIAEKLTLSVRTVDTQIYRALKVLKSRLKDYLIS